MPRSSRILFENAWYHILNRGAGRKAIFHHEAQRKFFIELLAKCSEEFALQIHAYCLMDNHFHLLVQTPQPTLSKGMKFLCETYAKRFNRDQKTDGPLFRSRFKSIVIDADSYLVQVSRYIHRNPVEARLCKNPADYAWSSYRAYRDPRFAPSWLKTGAVLNKAGVLGNIGEYCAFVENQHYASLQEFYDAQRVPGVLGSRDFKHYVSALGFADVAPKKETQTPSITIEQIESHVARLLGMDQRDVRESVRA